MENITHMNKKILLFLNISIDVRLVYSSPQTGTSLKSPRLIVEKTFELYRTRMSKPVLEGCNTAKIFCPPRTRLSPRHVSQVCLKYITCSINRFVSILHLNFTVK